MGFEVTSDLAASELSELLNTLNRFELWAGDWLPGSPATGRVPMKMLIFASHKSFRDYFGTPKFAGFAQPSLTTSTLVIAPRRGERGLQQIALHEYSHYLLRNRLDISLPLWFDEGLASLLSSVEFDSDQALLGELPVTSMRELTAENGPIRLSLQQALTTDYMMDWPRQRIDAFYYWSWLLTHYLMLGGEHEQSALENFLRSRAQPLVAYLDTGYGALERKLRRYVRRKYPEIVQSSPVPAPLDINLRCLTSLERDLLLGAAAVEYNPQGALELTASQQSADPQDVRILVLQSRAFEVLEQPEQALDLAQQAYQRAPENPAVLVNLANQLVHDCVFRQGSQCRALWQQALPFYRRALELDLNRIDAVFGIGLVYLHAGRPGEAVNYLKVAYSRTPWAVHVNFFLGESYRIIGDTRARGYLENARNWSQNAFWRGLAEAALERLDNPQTLQD